MCSCKSEGGQKRNLNNGKTWNLRLNKSIFQSIKHSIALISSTTNIHKLSLKQPIMMMDLLLKMFSLE